MTHIYKHHVYSIFNNTLRRMKILTTKRGILRDREKIQKMNGGNNA